MRKYVCHPNPWTEEQYIASMTPASKRIVYERAYETYLQDHRISSLVTPFTKIEKLKANKYKAPRMIQSRKPIFNIHYGKYIKSLEHHIIKHPYLGRHFGKGTIEQISRKFNSLQKKYKYYTEGDHTSFDAHVTIEHKKQLHIFYQSCYKHNKELRDLSKKTIHNTCISRHNDFYKISGTVMSGDVDTSFGNCIINLAILNHMLEQLDIKGEALVNGDDFVLFTAKPIPTDQAISILKTMNMECKLQPTRTTITSVSFCASKMVITPAGNHLLFHDPTKILDTFGMTHRINVPRKQYLHELAQCYAYILSHTPIGYHFAKAFDLQITDEAPELTTLEDNLRYMITQHKHAEFSTGEVTTSMYQAFPTLDENISRIYKIAKAVRSNHAYAQPDLYINHEQQSLHL